MRLTVELLLLVLLALGHAAEECHLETLDLVFVMDESKSIGIDNFEICLDSAAMLTESLDIGNETDKSRVGFVRFGNYAELGFKLTDYKTNADVAEAIRSQHFSGGGTNIASGMDFAIRQVFVPALRDAPRMMLIITDGRDNTDVTIEHNLALEDTIEVYAVGVGSDVDPIQLYNATGSVDRIYFANDYSTLPKVMQNICKDLASTAPTTSPPLSSKSCGCEVENVEDAQLWLDIIYVIDSSDGVSDDDFNSIKQFLMMMTTVNLKDSGTELQYTRMAIISTAEEAMDFLDLTTTMGSAQIRSYISKNLTKKGGLHFDAYKGLQLAHNMIVDENNAGRRRNVRKAVVMFTTASIDCHRQQLREKSGSGKNVLCDLAVVMEEASTALISVGVKLAGSNDYPYIDIVNKCNALNNGKTMVSDVLVALCRANCYCQHSQYQITEEIDCTEYAECIELHNSQVDYSAASETCRNEGGNLVEIQSAAKNNFILDLHLSAELYPYWIGMICDGRQCVYDDGNNLTNKDYTNWCTDKGQPNFQTGECVFQQQCHGFITAWFTDKCSASLSTSMHYFSCQKLACSVNNYCSFSIQ